MQGIFIILFSTWERDGHFFFLRTIFGYSQYSSSGSISIEFLWYHGYKSPILIQNFIFNLLYPASKHIWDCFMRKQIIILNNRRVYLNCWLLAISTNLTIHFFSWRLDTGFFCCCLNWNKAEFTYGI